MGKGDDGELVAVATAGDPMESSMLREFLISNGIDCMVQGENHRSLLQMVGAYIELRLLVPSSQAEEAAALIADFRKTAREEADAASATDDNPDAAGADADVPAEAAEADDDAWRQDDALRRRVRTARLLSLCFPGLGLGHFAVGAHKRGTLLAISWPAAFLWMGASPLMLVLPMAAAVFDFLFVPVAMSDVQRSAARLPRATARKTRTP